MSKNEKVRSALRAYASDFDANRPEKDGSSYSYDTRTLIVCKTPAEVLGTVYKSGGYFKTRDDQLIVCGMALSEGLRQAVTAHKTTLHRLVSAFGGRWPTQPKESL